MASASIQMSVGSEMFGSFRRFLANSRPWIRILLYCYVIVLVCPIRYWPMAEDFDNSWVFAINYAAAHGLSIGQDFFFNTGPLGYLVFPQDLGNNLSRGLTFQFIIWAILIGVLADLFFSCRLPLRNLAAFTVCFGLSAPLFWFNRVGLDNLLLAAALISLVAFRWRGNYFRFITALVLIGVTPMIKSTSTMLAVGALAGFLVDRAIERRGRIAGEAVLALIVPTSIASAICLFTIPSVHAFVMFVKTTIECASGYSVALSEVGALRDLLFAGFTIVFIVVILLLQIKINRRASAFFALFLTVPLAISMKHGFVRQDLHIINFFGFAALAIGLITLVFDNDWLLLLFLMFSVPFAMIWHRAVHLSTDNRGAIEMVSGVRGLRYLWHVRDLKGLRAWLRVQSDQEYTDSIRIEPELRHVIGDAPVSSLSYVYSDAVFLDNLNFVLYPLLQRANAYTPYLDQLSATWVREKAPRFLVFDGKAIDQRHPWLETPATWAEIYKWYDKRLLGPRNLLLERRINPRFQSMTSLGGSRFKLTEALTFSASHSLVLWKAPFALTTAGKLCRLFFRIPPTNIRVHTQKGDSYEFRLIPELLISPVFGASLPNNLAEIAALFDAGDHIQFPTDKVSFSGGGLRFYKSDVAIEYLRPTSSPKFAVATQ